MRRFWVCAVLVVCVVSVARRVPADDDSDRDSLLREIDDNVGRIADRMNGYDSNSPSYADDAISYANNVKDLVDKLDRVKGSDSHANDVVSRYPGYVDQFRQAAQYLRRAKDFQFKSKEIFDRCQADEADLQQFVRSYTGRPETMDEGLEKLPDKARDYGRKGNDAYDKLREYDRPMQDAASFARFSVSNDRWSDVSSRFSDSQQRILEFFRTNYERAEITCKRLALGEKHPDVDKALDDMRRYTGDAKQTVTQLKHDYNEWLRSVRKLREFTANDRDEIRDAMCKAGYYELDKRVNEVADRWASQISSSYGTILGQSDRLMSRATDDKLKKFKGSAQVREGLGWNRENLEKLKNYELAGSNNPKIRTKLEYGKKRHDEIESSICSGSNYAELEISSSYCSNSIRPGSGCRADCVQVASTCMVIEIKPNNDGAKEEGDRQRAAYADGLNRWYQGNKDELFSKYPNLKQCERDNKLQVDSRLETYDFCPSASEVQSMESELKDTSADVSESAE
ncbi:MAG: hypothetical protein ABJE66_37765 [Deltaproteobacteria bacterium]